jgi:hypothetical protein
MMERPLTRGAVLERSEGVTEPVGGLWWARGNRLRGN